MCSSDLRFDFTSRLAMMEESKSLPWSAVWEYYCTTKNVPTGSEWLNSVRKYEAEVSDSRG